MREFVDSRLELHEFLNVFSFVPNPKKRIHEILIISQDRRQQLIKTKSQKIRNFSIHTNIYSPFTGFVDLTRTTFQKSAFSFRICYYSQILVENEHLKFPNLRFS